MDSVNAHCLSEQQELDRRWKVQVDQKNLQDPNVFLCSTFEKKDPTKDYFKKLSIQCATDSTISESTPLASKS